MDLVCVVGCWQSKRAQAHALHSCCKRVQDSALSYTLSNISTCSTLSAEDNTRSAAEVIKHFHLDSEHCVGGIHQHLVGQRDLLVVVDSHQRKDPVGFVCLVHHQQKTGTLPHHLQ